MDYLPKSTGWLASWQLFLAVTSVFNTVQNFITLKLTKRIYNQANEEVNALQSRTFGIWTLTAAIIRFQVAYDIHDPNLYHLAIGTYWIAFAHFVSEIVIFRTANLKGGALAPCIVATSSLIWMYAQKEYYLSEL
ncbi:Erg28-like protein [Cantharellus anzutake]|uniref:Erg28-like protein n=1 Tax=Cantharellus anzutake TaxID=1750568 RepID=UPI0019076156|nr:Erg28-like protein [Cantharellus anzutake]KAF8335808.1 Erg28-like protein [Cantharellus anzutake]